MSAGLPAAGVSPGPARETGVDAMRLVALLGVVAIHAGGPTAPGQWFGVAGRFAVPFFFIASGFFQGSRADRPMATRLSALVRRLVPVWLAWLLLYAVYGYGLDALAGHPPRIAAYASEALVTGGFGYHLWFLPALVVCSVVVACIHDSLGWTALLALALPAYALGVAGAGYHVGPIPAGHASLDVACRALAGFGYVSLGYWAGVRDLRMGPRVAVCVLAAGMALHCVEASLASVALGHPLGTFQVTFSLAVAGFGALMVSRNVVVRSPFVASAAGVSMGAFTIHLALVRCASSLALAATWQGALILVLAVTAISVALAACIVRIKPLAWLMR